MQYLKQYVHMVILRTCRTLLEKMAHIRSYAISSIRFDDRLYTLDMSEASGGRMVSGNRVVSLPCRLPQDYATCPGWDVSNYRSW